MRRGSSWEVLSLLLVGQTIDDQERKGSKTNANIPVSNVIFLASINRLMILTAFDTPGLAKESSSRQVKLAANSDECSRL
jgi:hypothetical protein